MTKKTIGRKEAVEIIKSSKGKFFTAEFVDKDGKNRKMTCVYNKNSQDDVLGYIPVKEIVNKQTQFRNINSQTLFSLKSNKIEYKIK